MLTKCCRLLTCRITKGLSKAKHAWYQASAENEPPPTIHTDLCNCGSLGVTRLFAHPVLQSYDVLMILYNETRAFKNDFFILHGKTDWCCPTPPTSGFRNLINIAIRWDSLEGKSAHRQASAYTGQSKYRKSQPYIHVPSRIRTHESSVRVVENNIFLGTRDNYDGPVLALKYMVPRLTFVYRYLTHTNVYVTTSLTCLVSSNYSGT
jgi:hypothetical protein